MSFSFLDDAYPGWKNEQKCANEGNLSDVFSLYEDFDSSPKMPQPRGDVKPGSPSVYDGKPDADLRIETFKDYNLPLETATRGPGPKPYDSDDDYFKILSSDWERDVARYQANARDPFLPKDYSEESPRSEGKANANAGCVDVAHHLDDCKACRHRLEDIFRKVFERPSPTAKKNQDGGLGEWIMLIVIGMLIIFALDRLF